MGAFNPGAYSIILRTQAAYRFDVGTLLMRLFSYTTTIGTISMLTLAGASALQATSVASLIAICMFFVAPRVSKRIDERGQSAVVPPAALIAMAGLSLIFATTQFGWPFWLNYLGAPLVSFLPNAQALARTRWTFLITSGKLGDNAPPLKTAYAYEGILEDIAFMVGPAAVIALSAAIVPIAGMAIGAVAYCIGALLLISSKDTEPIPSEKTSGKRSLLSSIEATRSEKAPKSTTPDSTASKNADSSHQDAPSKSSVLRTTPVVRVLFAVMILFGSMYGALDAAIVSYCESIDFATLASITFAAESVFSVGMSFLFGMLALAAPLRRQFVAFATLFGCLYALIAFVDSPVSLIAIACVAGLSYAPLYITANVTCERAVPDARLTEAISWLASGQSIGMVIGPITAGAVIDALGALAGFKLTAVFALGVAILSLASIPTLRKHLP